VARDDGLGDDEPGSPLLPPDDRIWRHPSEVGGHGPPRVDVAGTTLPPRRRWWPAGVAAWLLAGATAGALLASLSGVGRAARTVSVPAVELVVAPGSMGPMTAPPEVVVSIADHLRAVVVKVRADGIGGPGEGTGVVFRSDGHILTNHRVVRGARGVTVVTADGAHLAGSVVGSDAETDIAVVKLDTAIDGLATAVIGSASTLRIGQMALALGASRDGGRPTMTVGVVRAVGMDVISPGRSPLTEMIQTDLPVTVASSGGPLVDAAGAVIGITTDLAGSTPETGRAGYATPIDVARDVAVQLITTGRVARSWLGIEGEDLDTLTANSLGLSGGARVKAVTADSPASRAGLAAGEVVTSLDGRPVRSLSGLKTLLRSHQPGRVVSLSVLGAAGPRSVRVRLAERAAPPR